MKTIIMIMMLWTNQYYNWEYCYSNGDYNFYVGARWECPDGKIKNPLMVRIFPKVELRECLSGPGVTVSDICLRLWDRDVDGDVDLRDVSLCL